MSLSYDNFCEINVILLPVIVNINNTFYNLLNEHWSWSPKCDFSGFTNCTYLCMYDYIYALLEVTIITDCLPNSTINPLFNSLDKLANNIQRYSPLLGGGGSFSKNITFWGPKVYFYKMYILYLLSSRRKLFTEIFKPVVGFYFIWFNILKTNMICLVTPQLN